MKRIKTLALVCLYSGCITLFLYCNRSGDKSESVAPLQSDYGLDVDSSGYTIWDGDRQVSHIPFDKDHVLDSIILNDNK